MNGESTSLFKVFRVLWFPLSINAMVLAAAAVVFFTVATWVACLIAGSGGFSEAASRAFLPATRQMLTTLTWPGFATEMEAGVRVPRKLVRAEAAAADVALIHSVFGAYERTERARIAALPADKHLAETNDLVQRLGRYRWIYAWQVAVFFALLATFGVAICRILALRSARDEYCTIGAAWDYAWRVKLTGLLFPIAVAIPIGLVVGFNFVVGAASQIPYVGWLFGILPYPFVLLASLLIVLLGVGGLLSIGLVPAAIAIERKGTYDSLGKTFNYVFARPLPLILYLVLLWWFLAVVEHLLIELNLIEHVTAETLSPLWSNPTYEAIALGRTEELTGFARICGWAYGFLLRVVHLLITGAVISYALGAFTAMFLIFRRDVDGLDYTDVANDPAALAAAARATPPPAPPPPVTPSPSA